MKFQRNSNWNWSRHLSTFSSGFDSISNWGKYTGWSEVLLLSVAPVFCATGSRPPVKKGIPLPLARTGEILSCRKFSWQAAFPAFSNIFYSFSRLASLYGEHYVYIHTSDTVETVYELPLLPSNTVVKHFYTNRSGAKCWPDIYRWGAGLRWLGEYVTLDRTFYSLLLNRKQQQPQLLPYFVLIAFLEEAFIRNIIITRCVNNTI